MLIEPTFSRANAELLSQAAAEEPAFSPLSAPAEGRGCCGDCGTDSSDSASASYIALGSRVFHRRVLANLRPARLQASLVEASLADLADLHLAFPKSTAMCLLYPAVLQPEKHRHATCVAGRACDL
jgi:hypothetical protein